MMVSPDQKMTMRMGLNFLVLLFGLCTIFASVVTVAEAWQEHLQARWPEVTARVDECSLDPTSSGLREKFHIRCRLSYAAGAEQHAANIHSNNVPSREVWQYPRNQIAPYEAWVNDHPEGTPIVVRYDPADHTKSCWWQPICRAVDSNSQQCEAAGISGRNFRDPADDCANHAAAILCAKRRFFNAVEPIGSRDSFGLVTFYLGGNCFNPVSHSLRIGRTRIGRTTSTARSGWWV